MLTVRKVALPEGLDLLSHHTHWLVTAEKANVLQMTLKKFYICDGIGIVHAGSLP